MTTPPSSLPLPAFLPEVVESIAAGLPPRLLKRLDAAALKLASRPRTREGTDGEDLRIAVDEEVDLVLHAPGGVVRTAADVHCGCLLAPACLHRAAVAVTAPLAEDPPDALSDPAALGPGTNLAPAHGVGPVPAPHSTPASALAPSAADTTPLSAAATSAARHLWTAAAATLAAGVSGAGGVRQVELLRAAHTARLAGLHRAATAAVDVASRLRAARAGDPEHRLADLVAAFRELLDVTRRLADPTVPQSDPALLGTARQSYATAGSLRLYGLFSEPVLTASHSGVVSWAADAAGTLSTIADVLPHPDAAAAAPAARGASHRSLRLGDTTITHAEFSREGLAVTGATRSATGRLGAGAGVRAVRAPGVGWSEAPLAALWEQPLPDQLARALGALSTPPPLRAAGSDLLFLDVALVGPSTSGGELLADHAGTRITLLPAHPHPDLPYRANLALLASAEPGLPLGVIGRLVPAARPRLQLLAAVLPEAAPVNLGFDRLQRADLPTSATSPSTEAQPRQPLADPPLHLLHRRVERAVTAGRAALTLAPAGPDPARLRRNGLTTAAQLLTALESAAASSSRDPFGRLRHHDHDAFAHAWLAAAGYQAGFGAALCISAWTGP